MSAAAILELLRDEGLVVHLDSKAIAVEGRSGAAVRVTIRSAAGEQTLDGSDILVAVGRTEHRTGPGSTSPAWRWTSAAMSRSTTGWRRVPPGSGPSASAPAARNSRMWRSMTSVSCERTSPAGRVPRAAA